MENLSDDGYVKKLSYRFVRLFPIMKPALFEKHIPIFAI